MNVIRKPVARETKDPLKKRDETGENLFLELQYVHELS